MKGLAGAHGSRTHRVTSCVAPPVLKTGGPTGTPPLPMATMLPGSRSCPRRQGAPISHGLTARAMMETPVRSEIRRLEGEGLRPGTIEVGRPGRRPDAVTMPSIADDARPRPDRTRRRPRVRDRARATLAVVLVSVRLVA